MAQLFDTSLSIIRPLSVFIIIIIIILFRYRLLKKKKANANPSIKKPLKRVQKRCKIDSDDSVTFTIKMSILLPMQILTTNIQHTGLCFNGDVFITSSLKKHFLCKHPHVKIQSDLKIAYIKTR